MKKNGKNVIFDEDIIVTTGNNKGKELSDVIGELQSKTSKLENYLKWIYKYGGVGGTGNGKGDPTTSYTVFASLGDIQINDEPIPFNSEGTYPLYIKISRPNGATFKVECKIITTINGSETTTTKTYKVDLSNDYEVVDNVILKGNGRIIITIQDDVDGTKTQLKAPFITNSFSVRYALCNNSGKEYSHNEFFISQVIGSGLFCKVEYELAIQAQLRYSIKITSPRGEITDNGNITVKQGASSGEELIDIIDVLKRNIDGWELTSEESGNYTVYIETSAITTGSDPIVKPLEKPYLFTLLPSDLYLLVQPIISTKPIYLTDPGDDTENIDEESMYPPGDVSFRIKPYQGASILPCTVTYFLNGNAEQSKSKEMNLRSEDIAQLTTLKIGKNRVTFILTCGSNTYECNIFFFVRETNFNLSWYHDPNRIISYVKDGQEKYLTNYYKRTSGTDSFATEAFLGLFNQYLGGFVEQTSTRKNIVIDNLTNNTSYESNLTHWTTIISIGLRYNSVNDINDPILSGKAKIGSDYSPVFELYQNKLGINSNWNNKLYIPKDNNYSDNTGFNYHLVNIVVRYVGDNGSNSLHEVTVYIDGIVESCFNTLLQNANLNIDRLTICSTNVKINLLDITYLSEKTLRVNNQSYTDTEDWTIYQYYLKYISEYGGNDRTITDEQRELCSLYYDCLKYDPTNGDVYCETISSVNNIKTLTGAPIMIFTIDNSQNYKGNWLDRGRNPNDSQRQEVSVRWTGINGDRNLTEDNESIIKFPENFSPDTHFEIDIQGTSTKSYKCKNFELYLVSEGSDEGSAQKYPVFSPNFVRTDEKTFLPERSFTLKADVVDSSHSNNTSVGKFVNDVCSKFNTYPSVVNVDLQNHIKNCLEGFPFLLFIQFINSEIDSSRCYFQGVYNFNLGRESHFNLGYCDYSAFTDSNGVCQLVDVTNSTEGFCFYLVDNNDIAIKDGVLAVEVQDNSTFFDFSQYDSTILFKDSGDKSAFPTMFGKVISGEGADTSYVHGGNLNDADISRQIIQNFVKQVSLSGGFLFEKLLHKTLSTDASIIYGYKHGYRTSGILPIAIHDPLSNNITRYENREVPLNLVPNYKYQIKREQTSSGDVFTHKTEMDPNLIEGIPQDLLETISETIASDEDETIISPWLDYKSVSEYYTICMALGLVDSVMKNLTIKTWTANIGENRNKSKGKFYAAFYDMDTCLGIDNKGDEVSYFAFSDYWQQTENIVSTDSDGNPVEIAPSNVTIYCDYSPLITTGENTETAGEDTEPTDEDTETTGGTEVESSFYDVPSSYLFAIAKYAKYYVDKNNISDKESIFQNTRDWPKQLWAKWRSLKMENSTDDTIGCLSSADEFIKNYFSNNLGSVSIPFINGNYRNKYFIDLVTRDGTSASSTTNLAKFNGTRINKTKDWLNNRFHILDAYFNLDTEAESSQSTMVVQFYEQKTAPDGNTCYDYTTVSNTGDIVNVPEINLNGLDIGNNDDILILRSIFGSNTLQGNASTVVKVKAEKYSPLVVITSGYSARYLIGNGSTTDYAITIPLLGTQTYNLLGSDAWVEMNSIDGFKISSLSINSKKLETLRGSSGNTVINTDSIIMPSLKEIYLTSSGYSGNININRNNYINLTTANLSGTRFSPITIDGSYLTSLDITNITSTEVSITNCPNINIFKISGARISNRFTFSPIPESLCTVDREFSLVTTNTTTFPNWTNNPNKGFVLDSNNIGSLTLKNTTITEDASLLQIRNMSSLKSIELSGFAEVRISNCENLETITISDPISNSGDYLKRLYINNCGNNIESTNIGKISNSGTNGLVDLTELRSLNYLCISNCYGINTVKLPEESSVFLSGSAFINDRNLRYLSGCNGTNCHIYITGTNTFAQCPNFTMRETENGNFSNLMVHPKINNISGTFCAGNTSENTSGSDCLGKITLVEAKKFLENFISDKSKITTANNLFKNQNITYSAEDLRSDVINNRKSLDLSAFSNLQSVRYMFAYNNINGWHRSWHNFGSNVNSIDNSEFLIRHTLNTNITTTTDVFYDIIDKIQYLGWDVGSGGSDGFQYAILSFIGNNGNLLEEVKIKDIFFVNSKFPKNVKQLHCLDFTNNTNQVLDFEELFNTGGWNSLTSIRRFLIANKHGNIKNFNELFNGENIPEKLTEIGDSFNFTNSICIDLYNFINWSFYYNSARSNVRDLFKRRYTLGANDGIDDYSTENSNFGFRKYITLDNFNSILDYLFSRTQTTTTGLSNIFRNCTLILENDQYQQFSLRFPSNGTFNGITTIHSMFDNFRVIINNNIGNITDENISSILDEGVSQPIVIDYSNFINKLTNLTDAQFAFRGFYFRNALSFNFFGKRYEDTNKPTVYIPKNPNITNYTNRFSSESDRTNYINENFYTGQLTKYNYRQELSDLRYMFCKARWYCSQDNSENARNFNPDEIGSEFYNTRNSNKFDNIKYLDGSTTNIIMDQSATYYVLTLRTNPIYQESGEVSSYEYSITYAKATFTPATEYSDILEIEKTLSFNNEDKGIGHYVLTIGSIGSKTLENFKIGTNLNSVIKRAIVAPDIFYGVNTSKNYVIQGFFHNTTRSYSDVDISNTASIYDIGSDETLEGILPTHLLSKCPTVSIRLTFRNLMVIPRFIGKYVVTSDTDTTEERIYTFVPKQFTECSDLGYSFCFRFLCPTTQSTSSGVSGTTTTIYRYTLLTDESLAKDKVSSLSNAFPYSYDSDESFLQSQSDFWTKKPYVYYNLMVSNLNYSTNPSEPDTIISRDIGINATSWKNLRYNHLVQGVPLLVYLSENLFTSNITINNLSTTNNEYIIYPTGFGLGGDNIRISKNIILPNAVNNGNYVKQRLIYLNGRTLTLYSNQVSSEYQDEYQNFDGQGAGHIIFIN